MMIRTPVRGATMAAALLFASLTGPAFAAASDYRFDLVGAHPAGAGKTDVTLRLVHLPDAKPVSGAVIVQPQAIMAGMESMPGAATAEPGPQPGTYVLHAATSMAGPWTLKLTASVQGEPETVRAAVVFQAGQ